MFSKRRRRDAPPPLDAPVTRAPLVTGIGAITAAFLASLCCIGPVLFVTLGVGAGLASRFEPLRALFTVLTFVLLAAGFYTVYGRGARQTTCARTPNGACTSPRNQKRDKTVLWSATIAAGIVLTFPQWSLLFV